MALTLYRVTTSIAGVDEESRQYFATEAEAVAEVLDWRGKVGDDTGDAWDVYAHPVSVDVPEDIPPALVLQLLNEGGVKQTGSTIIANRCAECDGPIDDVEYPNAFAKELKPLTIHCVECREDDTEDEDDDE